MGRIESFRDEFRFLSNFFSSPVRFGDEEYASIEHAYQAAKTLSLSDRCAIRAAKTPGKARRLGRVVTLRPAWDDIKLNIMRDLVWLKFTEHPELRARLLATEDAELVEGNTWGDDFWGVDLKTGRGENHLGKLLMETRDKIRKQQHAVLYAKRVAPELGLFEDMLKRARIQYTKDVTKDGDIFIVVEDEGGHGMVDFTFGKNSELMSIEVDGYGG